MAAKTMRKIQVPAYTPVDVGVHAFEKSGVVVEAKKVIAIMLIGIIVSVPISIEPGDAVAEPIGMDMDMLAIWPVAVGIDIESIAR